MVPHIQVGASEYVEWIHYDGRGTKRMSSEFSGSFGGLMDGQSPQKRKCTNSSIDPLFLRSCPTGRDVFQNPSFSQQKVSVLRYMMGP